MDLVILDIMMPKMDGYQFTKTFRETNNKLPILMVSAKQFPSQKEFMLLYKPLSYPGKIFTRIQLMANGHFLRVSGR